MGKIVANGKANDVELAGADGDASFPAMKFETDICSERQADVVALRTFEAKLSSFDACELLERPMVDFDQPGSIGKQFALGVGHGQATGRPVVRVAVWVNRPRHFDHALTAQMHHQAVWRDVQIANRLLLPR